VSDLVHLATTRAVVAGGASELGVACCHRLAGEGAAIAVIDAERRSADRVADEIRSKWGTHACAFSVDPTDWDDARGVIARVATALGGGIDVLVNQAAGARVTGAFAGEDPDSIAATVRHHLGGVVALTRAALDVMIPTGGGRIINVVAETGAIGLPGAVVYDACQAAIMGLTRNLAHELPDDGISVVAVSAGNVGDAGLFEQVANLVAFLASPAGAYAHGTVLNVAGGLPS